MEEQGNELRSKNIRSQKEGDGPVEPSCTEMKSITLDLFLAELCPIYSLHQELWFKPPAQARPPIASCPGSCSDDFM